MGQVNSKHVLNEVKVIRLGRAALAWMYWPIPGQSWPPCREKAILFVQGVSGRSG